MCGGAVSCTSPMSSDPGLQRTKIPDIVPIVLHQITKRRAEGTLGQECFEAKLERLSKEELQPRGLTVAVYELGGHTRFVLKDWNGDAVEIIDCASEGCHTVEAENDVVSAPRPVTAKLAAGGAY